MRFIQSHLKMNLAFLSSRRSLLAAAVLATAGGVALALRGRSTSTDALVDASLWQAEFDTLEGTRLALAAFRGKPLLINFWATWCPPCVEEMPLLERFFQQNRASGWQVVGLAIDQPSQVRRFVGQNQIHFPVGLAALGGSELARTLGNPSGGLPFSVVVTAPGQVAQRKIGKLNDADLQAWQRLR